MSKADEDIAGFRGTYSPDIEIGEDCKLRYTRDIPAGSQIEVPVHMFKYLGVDTILVPFDQMVSRRSD